MTLQQQQHSANLVMDDLMQGLNEWRNIQDIVRLTFKAFHDVLKAQGEAMKALERSVDTKAGRTETTLTLQTKANTSEVAARLRENRTPTAEVDASLSTAGDCLILGAKSDESGIQGPPRPSNHVNPCPSLSSAKKSTPMRASPPTASRRRTVVSYVSRRPPPVCTRVQLWKEHSERMMSGTCSDVGRLAKAVEEASAALGGKAGVVEVGAALSSKADVADMEERLRDKVGRQLLSESLSRKVDVSAMERVEVELRQGVASLDNQLSRKAAAHDLEELRLRGDRLRQRVEADSDTTATALRTISTTFDNTLVDVRGAAGRLWVPDPGPAGGTWREALSRKADATEVMILLDRKADTSSVTSALAKRADEVAAGLQGLESAVGVSLRGLEAAVAAATSRAESLTKDVANKMGVDKGLYLALEGKANVMDVNRALLEVCSELEGKACAAEVAKLGDEQALVNAGFAQNLHLARWLWRSGRTKAGGAVPWNVQAVNMDSHTFVWEQDRTSITATVPGLYELSFGFYSKRKPVVQVLVNGEITITAVGSSTHSLHTSPGSGSNVASASRALAASSLGSLSQLSLSSAHSESGVTGLTGHDVISLGPRAKISVTYQGDERGEGFLSLRKL
ncbi:MAG: hypothetical protein WDW38_001144 [Sanguina aurantia]